MREAGFDGALIRLRAATPQEIAGALPDRVQEQVACRATAALIRRHLDAGHYRTCAHLALNCAGMSRDALEISTRAGQDICRAILDRLGPHIGGICTHFASSDAAALRQSSDLFRRQAAWVIDNSDLSRAEVTVHAGSTLTLVSDTPVDTDMYRCGAILYGIVKPELGFRSTMDLEARVVSLQAYPAGAGVGYDRAHLLHRASRLACLSVGYENGFRRLAHGASAVSVRGALAPVLGKVSMNAIVADVTDIPSVRVGDTVRLFGGHDAAPITPPMAEAQFGTIMAELYTDWGRRNTRVHRQCAPAP